MATATASAPEHVFVSQKTICEILTSSPRRIGELAEAGLIRVRSLPGAARRYCLADALRLAESSTSGPMPPAAG